MVHQKINIRFGIITTCIILVMCSRIVPHIWNFTPVGAVCLFGSAYFEKKWQAYFVPLFAIWASDIYMNNVIYGQNNTFTLFYDGFYWQYIAYILIIFIAAFLFQKINVVRVLGGSLLATFLFFFISNFGVWVGSGMYAKTLLGLIECYIAAIPFLWATFTSDLLYSSVLFGSFSFAQKKIPLLQTS